MAAAAKEWLTVIEAATMLGVSEKTIRRGVANGSIPHMRPTGKRGSIRIPAGHIGAIIVPAEDAMPLRGLSRD